MTEVLLPEKRETTPSSLHVPTVERRILRMRSPSPGFRGRSQTPIRGRSMTPLQLFREKSATPSVWRSITPFISREEKEKTPFEIGPNILQQLASYKAIIDKALVMDISLEEEPPAKFIISEQSVIDKAAVMDLSNVEIIYVEDDDIEGESDYRESETPDSQAGTESHAPSEDREKSADLTAGSDDESGASEKKKKTKKAKKVVKKKTEKKEKEPSPPKLKLDLGDSKPKVSKAKMFEQAQKEEKPLDKPPPKKKVGGGKLTGALAAMKAEEAKMKEAEEQKKQIEEKMKKMKAEQEAKKAAVAEEKAAAVAAAAEEDEDEDEERSEKGSDEEHYESGSGSRSRSGSGSEGEGEEEQEDEELGEEEEEGESKDKRGGSESSDDDFYKPNPDEEALWSKLDEIEQGIIRAKYEPQQFKKLTERERFLAFQRARESARLPRIHSHIRDVTISEGNNVKLTCTASGPEMNIRWYKDGNPIEKGPRNRILVNEGILSLEILRALATDSGEYSCVLKNQNGEAQTSAIVTVYEIIKDDPIPPTFISARDYYHLNDDVLGIEVHCTGVPRPKVQWYHDMFAIKPSFKYTLLEEAHGVYKLEIYKPAAKDSGKYICKAQNSVGEAVIEHEVQFIGKPTHFHLHGIHHAHTEYQKEKEEAAKRAMEDAIKAKEEYELRKMGKLPPIVKRDDTPNIPQKDRLKFATQLRDRTALIGNKVKFTVSVMGPDPNIRWLKDGNPIQYGPNVRSLTSEGMSIVEILSLTTDHTGEYKCIARNNNSEAITTCYLKVYDAKSEGDQEAPLFVLSMRDVYHGPENDLVIDCKVRGNPRPLITWQKDDLAIEFDERMQQIEHLDGVCELIINKPTVKDSGKYSCTATNSIGSQTTSHQVEFIPHPSLPGSRRDSGMASSIAESDTEKDDKKGDKGGQAKGKAKGRLPPSSKVESAPSSRRQAPPTIEELLKASRAKLSFVTHLTNRVFPEGTKIKLSCVVQGPDPNVRWLRNDQPVVYSPRIRNLSKDGLCVLEINSCNLDDSGFYTCIVRNQESDIQCGCNVQVYETKQTADFAPTFTRSLKDTYHLNINELYLETHVRGQPHPTIEWFKDSVNIARNDPKYQVFDHPDGLCELIVNYPNNGDSGKYVCKATNRCGTTEIPHYVLFEGKEHHIAENIHGVYHHDHSRVERAKSEARNVLSNGSEASAENGVAEDDKSKKGGKGGQKKTSRPETPSTPAPSAPASPAKKEPRESRIGINFPTKLSNRVVASGSKVRLTCYLEGADPMVKWFKNDQPVVYSPRCRQNNQNGLCSLELTNVTVDDSGTYKCWARNTSGETSTSATLEVFSSGDSADLSPTFTRSLKETYNSKINEINITCHVRAIPKASITWSKDGVTVEPSDKYQLIEHDDGLCELNISDATKQDNGKYVCIAENRAGKAEIAHIVQIQIREHRSSISSLSSIKESPPTPTPDDEEKVTAKAPAGKGQPRQKKDAPPSGGGRRYAPQPPPDPKQQLFFIAFLTDRTIAEGGKTKISCYVEGPDPQARWFKDENPLQMSPRVRAETRDGLITLMIQNAVPEDSGVYRILVRNPASEITSSCTLNVYQTIKPTATAPLFTNSIKDTYNLHANELVLECRVRGEPQPSIQWTKDGNFIDIGDKYQQFDQADGLCRLIIYNPDVKDSGLYVCKADNSAGEDKTSHNVVFAGANSYINEKTHGYFHRDPNKPQFQNQLGNHLVTAGGTIALQAEIINEPSEVHWLCEKVPVTLNDKVRSIYDHGVYTLIIPEATKEQSGTYTCQAINAFGKTESHAHVHIVGPSVKGGKCPLFLSRPDNEMKIQTGDPFSFSFRLIGDPKPKLILLKGIRDITHSDRTLKEAHDDFIRFSVQNSKPTDSGTYCIVARNQHGTDRAFVTITVKSPKHKK